MAWLDELERIAGDRWSAGATWADSGASIPGESEWIDETTWDAAHEYNPAGQLAFGIFAAGVDVTADVHSASWGLGQMDPHPTSIAINSASLTLKDTDRARAVEPGDRIVALTQTDTLWVGTVEGVGESRRAGELTVLTVTAVDDLARPAIELDERDIGGWGIPIAEKLLRIMGIGMPAFGQDPGDRHRNSLDGRVPGTTVFTSARSGSALSILGQALYFCVSAGAWTAGGLRIGSVYPYWDGYWRQELDSLDDFAEWTEDLSIDRTVNFLRLYSETYGEFRWRDLDSIEQHGLRPLELDTEAWEDPDGTYRIYWDNIWGDAIFGPLDTEYGWFAPQRTFTARGHVTARRHRIARLVPFDQLADGDVTEVDRGYRVLRVGHQITPDRWTVSLEGVAVNAAAIT